MKKLFCFFGVFFILWVCGHVILMSCESSNKNIAPDQQLPTRTNILIVDSCEYVVYKGWNESSITHHGNCKFCKARKL